MESEGGRVPHGFDGDPRLCKSHAPSPPGASLRRQPVKRFCIVLKESQDPPAPQGGPQSTPAPLPNTGADAALAGGWGGHDAAASDTHTVIRVAPLGTGNSSRPAGCNASAGLASAEHRAATRPRPASARLARSRSIAESLLAPSSFKFESTLLLSQGPLFEKDTAEVCRCRREASPPQLQEPDGRRPRPKPSIMREVRLRCAG